METKHCIKCKTEQPFDYFVNDKNRPDGKFPYCKTCTSRNPSKFVEQYFNKQNGVWKCSDCKETKDLKTGFYKNKASETGFTYQCKECHGGRRNKWKNDNKEKRVAWERRSNLKQYGITTLDYERILFEQDESCAICGRKDFGSRRVKYFFVDHDHQTGRVRGLLCSKCNQAIGLFGDSVENLQKAMNYLSRGAFAAKQVISPDKQVVERTAV
jgi:hypothetical protein